MRGRWFLLAALAACQVAQPPGDQNLGTWAVSATDRELGACELSEFVVNDGGSTALSFQAVLTRDSATAAAWLTIAGYSRDASFDGQYFESEAAASRVFDGCEACKTRLVETFSVAVLSERQAAALAGQCPEPGAGVPLDVDAGVTGPSLAGGTFDAVRLCGALRTMVAADGLSDGGACEARCSGCEVRYRVRAERR